MSIIYTSISAKGILLSDFSSAKGNFVLISQQLLKQNDLNKKYLSLQYQDYVFFIINAQQTYLVLTTQDYPLRIAFAFLEEIRKRFQSQYSTSDRSTGQAYSFKKFSPALQKYTDLYNQPHKVDKLQNMKVKVEELHRIQRENLQKMQVRGQKIEVLVDRSQTMASLSMDLHKNARSLRQQMEWKNKKWWVIGILVSILVIYLIMVMSCNGFALKGCF